MHRDDEQYPLAAREEESKAAAVARHRAGRLSFAALIVGNLCLAFGPWLVRLADVGPIAAAFWRLAIAAPLLVIFAAIGGQAIWRIPRRLWIVIALAGLFFAVDLATWHAGILRTHLANASLFANIAVFTFAAYGFVVARQWPHRRQTIALTMAAVGAALLLGRSFDLSLRHAVGDLLCITAGMLYTGYLIAIDRARGTIGPMPVLAAATLVGVIPLLLAAIGAGERILPTDWMPVVLLALGSQVIGQGLIVYAITQQSPLVVGLSLLIQPIAAAAIGWVRYGERLEALDLIGMGVIAVALVVVRGSGRDRSLPLPPVAGSA